MRDRRLLNLAHAIGRMIAASPYTASDVARELHVDKSAVSKWISGERTPTMKNLLDLVDLVKRDMRELWTGPEAVPATPVQKVIVEYAARLPEGQQEAFAAMLAALVRDGQPPLLPPPNKK